MKFNQTTICYLSELGHKNFWYPTNNKAILIEDCELEKLNWVCGANSNLIAYKAPKACLLPIDINEESMKYTKPPQTEGYTVVWIKR